MRVARINHLLSSINEYKTTRSRPLLHNGSLFLVFFHKLITDVILDVCKMHDKLVHHVTSWRSGIPFGYFFLKFKSIKIR